GSLDSRKDRARIRKLDGELLGVLEDILDNARAASALQGLPSDAVQEELLDALARPSGWSEASLHELTASAFPPPHSGPLAALSVAALERAIAAVETLANCRWPEAALALDTTEGRIWVGTTGNDTFEAPFIAVVDPGGHDLYLGDGQGQPISVIIDLGGDDTYRSPPTAEGGIAILLDDSGDDDYRGGRASLGAGLWGCGVLLDRAGNDTYRGGPWSLGVGLAGVGLLLDDSGDDSYRVEAPGQGMGGPGGFGALVDQGGHDIYHASGDGGSQGHGRGPGPWLAGGLGLLADLAGDDLYRADSWSQGSGIFFGLGVAADHAGDDHWIARDWSQGTGGHGGLGVLVDREGDDGYHAGIAAQGSGLDRAMGGLWELAGDDRYLAASRAQGTATGAGLGLLVDRSGADAYQVMDTEQRWGWTEPLRGEEAIAAQLDLAGKDIYGPHGDRADGQARSASRHGVGIDLRAAPGTTFTSTAARALPTPATEAETADLLTTASHWLDDPDAATAARDRLAAAGPGLYPVLRTHLDAGHPGTGAAIEAVVLQMAATDEAWAEALDLAVTADLTRGIDDASAAHLLVWAARLPGDVAPTALGYLDHAVPDVRRAAAAVLEESCSDGVASALIQTLENDDAALVRATAARSLGGCVVEASVPPLARALRDEALPVRDTASGSLVLLARRGLESEVRAAIRPLVASGDIPALEVLIRVPDASTLPALEILLTHPEAGVRANAALALGALGNHAARKALMGREAVEGHPYVQWCLDRALRTPGNSAAMVPDLR
ncbi:MAG: hypothetical protein ABIG85_06875, partial [Chloroflexota bacterium]